MPIHDSGGSCSSSSILSRAFEIRSRAKPSVQFFGTSSVDLLPDRTAGSLAAWLKERGSVAVITRDRSSEYARGAALGAPNAVQVCDRWHLLQNLREMIERWLGGIHGRLRRLPRVAGEQAVPSRPIPARARTQAEAARSAGSRARRLAHYEEVRRRFGAGEKLLATSRAT